MRSRYGPRMTWTKFRNTYLRTASARPEGLDLLPSFLYGMVPCLL